MYSPVFVYLCCFVKLLPQRGSLCARVPHNAAGGLHAGLHPECLSDTHTHTHTHTYTHTHTHSLTHSLSHTHTHTHTHGTTRDFKALKPGAMRNFSETVHLGDAILFNNVGTQTPNCIVITRRSRYKLMQCSLQCLTLQVLSVLMLNFEVLRHATPCRSDLTPNMKALVFSKTSGNIIQRYDVTAQKAWNF